jgi:pimeloyl-ACP methyl ester carboxylesterase
MSATRSSEHADAPAWPGLVVRPGSGDHSKGWPDGVTAVLVHGAMDRGAGMTRLVRSLADAPTIRYDRRGYGRARGMEAGTLVRQVDDLVAIASGGPVVLFGHSYGGLIVLAAASTGRLDVRGVAVYEAPAPWLDEWPRWDFLEAEGRTLTDEEAGDVAERFLRRMIGDAHWDRLPARTRADRRAEGRALLADVDPSVAVAMPFEASRIGVPCVIGCGTISPPWYDHAAAWLADRLPNGMHRRLQGADHGAPLDDPDAVADLIRRAAAG